MTTIEVWNKTYFPESGEDIFDYIEQAMREYARIKCLEAIKNVRHKACEIILEHHDSQFDCDRTLDFIERDIMNIPNQDVMPEL